LSGLGPAPLSAGDELPIGASGSLSVGGEAGVEPSEPQGSVQLSVVLGPRADRFTDEAIATLQDAEWTVGIDANRVGVHLDGPALVRRHPGELPTEPMVAGAIQVPGSGRPVLFLADHPVTGGYPVIAVLTSGAIGLAAQLRPGRRRRFRPVPDPLTGFSR
jgi:allophanate hydrolase subunit 2